MAVKVTYNTMVTRKQKNSTRKTWLVLALVVLLAVGMIGFWRYRNYQTYLDQQAQIKAQDEAQTNSAKNDSIENDEKGLENSVPSSSTSDEIEASPTLVASIDSFDQSDRVVHVTASVTDKSGSGECVFQFSSTDSRPVVKQATASGGACSVAISEAEFDKVGTWALKFTYYANNMKSEAVKDVEIQ